MRQYQPFHEGSEDEGFKWVVYLSINEGLGPYKLLAVCNYKEHADEYQRYYVEEGYKLGRALHKWNKEYRENIHTLGWMTSNPRPFHPNDMVEPLGSDFGRDQYDVLIEKVEHMDMWSVANLPFIQEPSTSTT